MQQCCKKYLINLAIVPTRAEQTCAQVKGNSLVNYVPALAIKSARAIISW